MKTLSAHALVEAIWHERIAPSCLDDFLLSGLEAAAEIRLNLTDVWTPHLSVHPSTPTERRAYLSDLAPTLLLDGVWLARVAQPATAHKACEAHLFALYRHLSSPAHLPAAPQRLLQAGLIESGWADTLVGCLDASEHPQAASIWYLPALQLALLHRPRRFLPELLGFTLAHQQMDGQWWHQVLPPGMDHWIQQRIAGQDTRRRLIGQAIAECPLRTQADFQNRLARGQRLYHSGFAPLIAGTAARLQAVPTRQEAVRDLIQRKRAYAVGYHGRVMLEGRSLDEWLEEHGHTTEWLEWLARSTYTDKACPEGSRLLKAMQFGGPMFGVFSPAEQHVWAEWMSESAEVIRLTPPQHTDVWAVDFPPTVKEQGRRYGSCRELYRPLLDTETPLAIPAAAKTVVQRFLRRGDWLSHVPGRRPFPRQYTAEQLHHYIHQTHLSELKRYRPLAASPGISLEFCRYALVQLAPAILIDGAWLIGLNAYGGALDQPREDLLRIYADEIGAGCVEWNHPNVYRRLLDSQNVHLPPFDSDDFARATCFMDAAFELPVYLLSIGWQAEQYFPELLGLNLAIELSGLGAMYLRAIDILEHYGIDPTLFRLHLSIDNPASGHTALAERAIRTYMDNQRRQLGAAAMALVWKRVRRGYHSLNAATLGLLGGLAWRYQMGHRRGSSGLC
ncbi:MAG: iron-containing redox enzyme family protein [Methylococcaceae bacterium]